MNKEEEIKIAICNFTMKLCAKERFIEINRQLLCDRSDFEPYVAFRRVARGDSQGLSASNIHRFLSDSGVSIPMNRCQIILDHYDSDKDGLLSYKEFLEIVLPKEHAELRSFVTQRECFEIKDEEFLNYDTETGLASLLMKELHIFEDCFDEKEHMDQLQLTPDILMNIIDIEDEGCINYNNLKTFFQDSGLIPYDSEIISFLRRIDKDDDGVILLEELVHFLGLFHRSESSEEHEKFRRSKSMSRSDLQKSTPQRRIVQNTVTLLKSDKKKILEKVRNPSSRSREPHIEPNKEKENLTPTTSEFRTKNTEQAETRQALNRGYKGRDEEYRRRTPEPAFVNSTTKTIAPTNKVENIGEDEYEERQDASFRRSRTNIERESNRNPIPYERESNRNPIPYERESNRYPVPSDKKIYRVRKDIGVERPKDLPEPMSRERNRSREYLNYNKIQNPKSEIVQNPSYTAPRSETYINPAPVYKRDERRSHKLIEAPMEQHRYRKPHTQEAHRDASPLGAFEDNQNRGNPHLQSPVKRNFVHNSSPVKRKVISNDSAIKFLDALMMIVDQERNLEIARRDLVTQADFSMKSIFQLIDKKNRGWFTIEDFRQFLTYIGIQEIDTRALIDLYSSFDTNQNCLLNFSELVKMLCPSTPKYAQIADRDDSQNMNVSDSPSLEALADMFTQLFLLRKQIFEAKKKIRQSNIDLHLLFDKLDYSGEGFLIPDDLLKFLASISPELADSIEGFELEALMKRMDIDNDDRINFKDFYMFFTL